MSKNGKLIFKTFNPNVTSPFGYRIHPIDKVKKFHQGVDYGTNGVKVAQYAIEDGVVTGCGTDNTGAKYVYVKYPRLNKTGLHYHLDRYCVSNGQSVNANTIIGYTGATGRVTGIHLHFGWFPTEDRNKSWNEKRWEDFEAYNYVPKSSGNERVRKLQQVLNQQYGCGLVEDGLFGPLTTNACSKNYLYKGKKASIHIKWLQNRLVELGYSVGNYGIDGSFGNDTLNAVKQFQRDRGIAVDGYVGKDTHRKLVE